MWSKMMVGSIRLVPVTVDSWQACIALTLAPDQQDFVASNLYSIAEAQFHPAIKVRAIAAANDQIIGLVVYGFSPTSHQYKIARLMIDQHQQGYGYGRAAMEAVVADVLATSDATELWLSYRVANHRARRLYLALGFREHNQDENGRITAALDLSPRRET